MKRKAELEQAAQQHALEQEKQLRSAKSSADQDAKDRAIGDAKRAQKNGVNIQVFGVSLGTPLELPQCDTEDGLFGRRVTSDTTCLRRNQDGSSDLHWSSDAVPSWATDLTTDVRGDVLVSVKISFLADPTPPPTGICFGIACTTAAMQQASYPGRVKQARENVAKAHKQLRSKYGKPTHSQMARFKNDYGTVVRQVEDMDWVLPGLHVAYESDSTDDTVLIELESIRRERAEQTEAEETAEPKL
jgi:hypothetical protein